MKIIIYKIENKITKSVYIGKTNNLKRRMREHGSVAFNPNSEDYYKLLSKKIRQYGKESFTLEVLEECNEGNWREREAHWIAHYNSFRGSGYNETKGGDGVSVGNYCEDIKEELLNDLLNSKETQRKIAAKYEISEGVLSNFNQGFICKMEGVKYPIRQNYFSDEHLLKVKELLEETTMPLREIALQLGMAESTVKKINSGLINHSHIFKSYPVRKIQRYQKEAEKAIELLQTTDLSYAEIGKIANLTKGTVGRINNGETRKDPKLKYPIR